MPGDLRQRLGPEQPPHLVGVEHRRCVEVTLGAIEREVAEKTPAGRPVRHHGAKSAACLAERAGNPLADPLALFDDVLVVASEELVATVAAQHHLDVFGGELRHHVGRNRRRVAERLVEIPREILDDLHHIRAQDEVVVIGPELRRNLPRVG